MSAAGSFGRVLSEQGEQKKWATGFQEGGGPCLLLFSLTICRSDRAVHNWQQRRTQGRLVEGAEIWTSSGGGLGGQGGKPAIALTAYGSRHVPLCLASLVLAGLLCSLLQITNRPIRGVRLRQGPLSQLWPMSLDDCLAAWCIHKQASIQAPDAFCLPLTSICLAVRFCLSSRTVRRLIPFLSLLLLSLSSPSPTSIIPLPPTISLVLFSLLHRLTYTSRGVHFGLHPLRPSRCCRPR